MALKPTIYKVQLQLADTDRNRYEQIALTLALHPSETEERLVARLLAYALAYEPGLEFTRGLSTSDEPDIWRHTDDGTLVQWIEMGQPELARLRKGLSRTPGATVYAFGKSADTWWRLNAEQLRALPKLTIWQLPWLEINTLSRALTRNATMSVSVTGGVVYTDIGGTTTDFVPTPLLAA